MPIKWSTVRVSRNADEVEELMSSIRPTLWLIREKAEELRQVPHLLAYIDQNLETKLSAAKDAVRWLNDRINEEREKVEAAEKALLQYKEKNQIITGFSSDAENITAQVVSMPCWKLFEKQNQEYKDSVIPPEVKARVGIEAGIELGWNKWIGDNGVFVGMSSFGASAPAKICFEKFGITVDNVVTAAKNS